MIKVPCSSMQWPLPVQNSAAFVYFVSLFLHGIGTSEQSPIMELCSPVYNIQDELRQKLSIIVTQLCVT